MSKIEIAPQTGWNIFIMWLGVILGGVIGLFWGSRPYVAVWILVTALVVGLFLRYCTKDKVPVEVQSEGDAKDTPRDENLQA